MQRGGAVGRDDNPVGDPAALPLPARDDPSGGGVVRCLEPLGSDEVGFEQDVAETRAGGIGTYAAQRLEEPPADLAEHHVVVRDVARGLEVPVFEQRRRSVHDPPAPRRIGRLYGNTVGRFGMAVPAQGVEDGPGAQYADVEVAARLLDPSGEILRHARDLLFGDNAPQERDAQFGLCAAGVETCLRVVVLAVDGRADLLGQRRVAGVVLAASEEFGRTGQDRGIDEEVDRRGELERRARAHRHPVAASPRGQPLGAAAIDVIDIAADVFIAGLERCRVSVEEIEVPRDERDGARPVQPVVRSVAPAARGDDVGQHAVGLLFVAVVGQPLLVDRDCVVVVEGRLDGQVAVARPAVLLALRTVGRVTHQVREVGFVRGLPQLLDEPLR